MVDFLRLSPSSYLDAVLVESDLLTGAARRVGLETTVPTCPEWDIAKLVLHVGVLHRWVAAMVAGGMKEQLEIRSIERAPDGPARIDWLSQGTATLAQALENAGTDREVWTLVGLGRSAFWFRRMAQETLVHRFDVEIAVGSRGSVDPLLAADGIDEYWGLQLDRKLARAPVEGLDCVIELRASDVDANWTVQLRPDSAKLLTAETKIEATATGPAEELLAFLWRRGPLASCSLAGERSLIEALPNLVPL